MTSSRITPTRSDMASFSNRYIFSLLTVDVLNLPLRKPLFFGLLRATQLIIRKSSAIESILRNVIIHPFTKSQSLTPEKVLASIRQLLFPTDTILGPRRIIPTTEEELEPIKVTTIGNMWEVCQLYRMDTLLGLEKVDMENFIETCCLEKRCNKILVWQILECLLAHLVEINVDDV